MDHLTLKQLGEWRLAELRRVATAERERPRGRSGALQPARLRRAIGGAIVSAGLRVMGDGAAAPVREA